MALADGACAIESLAHFGLVRARTRFRVLKSVGRGSLRNSDEGNAHTVHTVITVLVSADCPVAHIIDSRELGECPIVLTNHAPRPSEVYAH